MACGCNKRRGGTTPTALNRAVQAGSQTFYEVDVNGSFSGRRFTTLLAAQRYADSRGGTVRTVS
jgi:hypothetical protein